MFDVTQNRRFTSENRQTGRRSSKDRTPGEHRQDGSYENNQPTTTTAATSSANHHQREGFERGYFFHLSREHCLNHRRNGRGCQIENREGEKHIHQPETNLEIFVTQHQQQNTDFQYKRQVSFAIRIRNLAGHKEYFQQPVADLYQQLSSFYTED
ncbi:unnamed protein product [Trichobilharzia szidati]|nr:unnamed protein product [Trichobilharzia szidati]